MTEEDHTQSEGKNSQATDAGHQSAQPPHNDEATQEPSDRTQSPLSWRSFTIIFRRAVAVLHHYDGLITAVATVWIGAFTCSLATDSVRQIKTTNGQLNVMQGQLDAMRTEQRPFITVTFSKTDTPEWSITPLIKNSGNTPTRDLDFVWATPWTDPFLMMDRARRSSDYTKTLQRLQQEERRLNSPSDPEDMFQISNSRGNVGNIKYPIGPKDSISLPSITQSEIGIHLEQMLNGEDSSYLYGAIRYRDTFKESEWHITKFCLNVASAVLMGGGGKKTPVAAPCRHWNCADDECKSDKAAYEKEKASLSPPP